jgi:hypothetical protein
MKLGVNVSFLCPRNLNQDPIEFFFSCLRGLVGRNINPMCSAFAANQKAMVLNNFTSSHSPNSNCQEDDGEALDTLKKFLQVDMSGIEPLPEITEELVEGEEEFKVTGNINVITTQLHSYLAGYIGKQYLKRIVCKTCRNHILTNIREEGGLVEARAYSAKALLNANSKFRRIFSRSCEVLFFCQKCVLQPIKKKIETKII